MVLTRDKSRLKKSTPDHSHLFSTVTLDQLRRMLPRADDATLIAVLEFVARPDVAAVLNDLVTGQKTQNDLVQETLAMLANVYAMGAPRISGK